MIRENIAAIRQKMTEAALACGRDPGEILLCAATKMNDSEAVKEAVANGVDCCGENRVQELLQKQPLGAYEGKPVHFIGHLQTNKVKQVVGRVDLIQSVDRLPLLEAIEKEAAKQGLRQDILLEINIGDEESKSGFTPGAVMELVQNMGAFPHCHVLGLMAIPPISTEPGGNRKYFTEMYQIFVDIREKTYDNVDMVCLSMGMSDDYADAIACGSTMIRVGTAIFGARNYSV
ncbi:MAG: YggS family pyridoxal phosphate-dependent enzyme [Oscillospiraceae bacterium]|nr:YggS family pyridoxal phosphate-dependent enzyme [Oscillospiraceae bacterium]